MRTASSAMDYLTSLLPELQIQVIEYLDYPSLVVLSQTNQYFRSIIQVQIPTTTEQKLSYLFSAENWKKNKKSFACSQCLKLRPRNKFANKQVKREYRKKFAQCSLRYCLQCGPPRVKRRKKAAMCIDGCVFFTLAVSFDMILSMGCFVYTVVETVVFWKATRLKQRM
ncbi:hypothetical protein ASPBRDRAFT_187457 [Aspergillus brasiliensis CBS 101740]|uniref:F-box domain-containing protein n=1 Tax=Aspergillus brasiliensis (strain CBS 101740 / IMI 381727 / IBT 21946) TaxID=767769 RepID=A0A1L9U5C5_ASPBC|nr:hypothetical protein ASPBRDRAFT_187457 [Aspergillus brasiliensis CBS 101740]